MGRHASQIRLAIGISILVLTMLAGLVAAQNQPPQNPQVMLIGIGHLQPGVYPEFQNFVKDEWLPAWKKVGRTTPSYFLRGATFGQSGEFLQATPIEDLALLDGPSPLSKLGEEARALNAKRQRFIKDFRTVGIITQPDMSIAPAPGYVPKLVVANSLSVTPGRSAEFEKWFKAEIPALKKIPFVRGMLVNRVIFGGDSNEYGVLTLFDSFADAGQYPAAYAKSAAEAKLAPAPAGLVTHAERTTYIFVPELSFLPPPPQNPGK